MSSSVREATASPAAPIAEPPPLGSERKVAIVGGIGVGLCAIAAVAGGLFPSGPNAEAWVNDIVAPLRSILSVVGLLFAGAAITLRPGWFAGWLLGAAACFAAGCGFPGTLYTISFVAFVFSGVAIIGAFLTVLPLAWRITVASGLALLHFSGILTAVLSPPPAPELVNQLWVVASRPYLQFVYLNNAYQFYSPDPGAASELWFCVEYETHIDDPVLMEALQYTPEGEPLREKGELIYLPLVDENEEPKGFPVYDRAGNWIFRPQLDAYGNEMFRPLFDQDNVELKPRYMKTHVWHKMPRRPRDRKDPLFQTYYRRLSITESVVQGTPMTNLAWSLQVEARRRRQSVTPEMKLVPRDRQIPNFEADTPINRQYLFPDNHTLSVFLPNYAHRIATEFHRADRKVVGVKIYRVYHEILEVATFVGEKDERTGMRYPVSPFNPTSYWPYFMGDYDPDGKLRDPGDPMLYWLVPIRRRSDAGLSIKDFSKPVNTLREYKRLYEDFAAVHAGSHHMAREFEK
jgi:hypothetical protein